MRTLTLVFCLYGAIAALAQGAEPEANTLTAKEISDGWLLLFDGTTEFGWKSEGALKTEDGKLALKSDVMKKAFARHTGRFQDFELRFNYAQEGKAPNASVLLRMSEEKGGRLDLQDFRSQEPTNAPANIWTTTHVDSIESTCSISFDRRKGMKKVGRGRRGMIPSVQLQWNASDGTNLYLKNIKIRPVELKPLFNGKDLTGWKGFPGKKSKFTVTPDGAINIKNGPGDLQTEGKYGDFVLQLECISNGKHLNSGVFFRCRPNEYQNGYEAQIRNQFTAAPTQDYTLEEYEPQTHKLLSKKKAKFTAVDYGTGAIYRRQPARREVSKDGEWFTMTIVAYKNHFATWVNGIQVTDWTDNRPPSDNARTGCRLAAGHISLQGHDPTTDLSFRNIRIAEIK